MSSSTSSSETARARRFLGLAFAGALVVEASFGLAAREHRGRHEVDDCAHAVAAFGTPPRTVLLADSISYGVLDAVTLPDDVLDLSNNQTIGAAGNFFLLQRLARELDRRGASGPSHLVMVMSPDSWDSNLDSATLLEPYFVTVFDGAGEIASVAGSLERPALVAAMRRSRWESALQLPSYLRRGLVQAPLRDGLRGLKRRLQEGLGGANEAPGGAALWAEAARAKIAARAAVAGFVVAPVTEAYLPQLAALCAERGARLVLMPAPLPPTVVAAWRANGLWQDYLETLARLTAEHPALVLEECPYRAPSDESFYDGVHLVQSAKNAWAQVLAGVLAAPEELEP